MFKKWKKGMIMRMVLFLGLAYLIIPNLINFLARNESVSIGYNFFSFSAFTFILIVLFGIFNRDVLINFKEKLNSREIVIFSLLSLFFFTSYFYMKYLFNYKISSFPGVFVVYFFFYLLGIIFLGLAIFGINFFKQTYKSSIALLAVTSIFYYITNTLWQFWEFFSTGIAKAAYFLLSIFSSSASLNLSLSNPTLALGNFSVIIGSPCSGIESMSMFMGLFLLLIVYDQNQLNFRRAGIIFVLGLIGSYLLNIIRVSAVMFVGTKNSNFALGLFHSQVGWIFFSIFILFLIYFGYDWMKKKE